MTLVDAAFPDDGERLADVIEAEFGGLDRILVTHGDEGHFGGVPVLIERFAPKLAVPAGGRVSTRHWPSIPTSSSSTRTCWPEPSARSRSRFHGGDDCVPPRGRPDADRRRYARGVGSARSTAGVSRAAGRAVQRR
ncbi:MBL fold metallo-hydrolase [Haloterrigena turkmenica]|uniref:MBL fold metallo-hydrolase n=1 Tax=Haloterrigena turkmenica TaxID=62320 RepID=UPI001CF7D4C9|nr:MBL fold metallo-hydrolase [Haloterrigena turkmenica]